MVSLYYLEYEEVSGLRYGGGLSPSKTEALQVQRQRDDIIRSICLHEAKFAHKG
jgi:hypothetical protein